MTEKFNVTCKKCGSPAKVVHDDNGACGDPNCCGEREYWIEIRCTNKECKETETEVSE
jgi:hypothetical protein